MESSSHCHLLGLLLCMLRCLSGFLIYEGILKTQALPCYKMAQWSDPLSWRPVCCLWHPVFDFRTLIRVSSNHSLLNLYSSKSYCGTSSLNKYSCIKTANTLYSLLFLLLKQFPNVLWTSSFIWIKENFLFPYSFSKYNNIFIAFIFVLGYSNWS